MLVDFHPCPSLLAIDTAHAAFVFGSVLAKKPAEVLELGIGTGFVSHLILMGLRYNGTGKLTCVDTWADLGHSEPDFITGMRSAGAEIIAPMEEHLFLNDCPSDRFDMLVADADHHRSHQWLEQYQRVVRNGGLLFFHDTNQPSMFPGLAALEERLKELNPVHFKRSTRPDEKCERGFLFAVNRK